MKKDQHYPQLLAMGNVVASAMALIGNYLAIPKEAKSKNPAKRLLVYDIETFPNLLLICFRQINKDGSKGQQWLYYHYEHEDGSIEENSNLGQIWEVVENSLLVGYNSKSYDNPLLCYILDCIATDKSMYDNQTLTIYNENKQMLGNHYAKCSNFYQTSQLLINGEPDRYSGEMRFPYKFKKFKHNPYFRFIDLMEILRAGYNIKSLKLIGVNLMHPLLQDLPYRFDKRLTWKEVQQVMAYCWNDIDITEKVYYHVKPRIEMRIGLGKLYNIDCLTEADSGIVNIINDKFYSEASGIPVSELSRLRTLRRYDIPIGEEVYNGKIHFETEYLKTFLEEFNKIHIIYNGKSEEAKRDDTKEYIFPHYDSLSPALQKYVVTEGSHKNLETKAGLKGHVNGFTLECFGVKFTFGLGGIHTIDKAGIDAEDENYYLIDVDVDSYYPSRVLIDEIYPAHLDKDVYLDKYRRVIETRLDAKAKSKLDNGETLTFHFVNTGLKICVNGEYGKYNYKFYWLYDPLCTFKVTINNQLDILKLCEKLHLNGDSILSANTDGVTVRIRKKDDEGQPSDKYLNSFRATWNQWCAETGFTMEEVRYKKIVRKDINNYMVVTDYGGVKAKGSYFDKDRIWDVMKGFSAPIVSVALSYYYTDDIPVEDTVRNFITEGQVEGTKAYTETKGHHPINWYCIANKIDSSFTNVIQPAKKLVITHSPKTGKEYKRPKIEWVVAKDIPTQNTCRYYMHNPAGNGTIGTLLTKRKEVEVIDKETGEVSTEYKYTAHQKNEFVKLFNKTVEYAIESIDKYEINYDWYINQCHKVIASIENTTP